MIGDLNTFLQYIAALYFTICIDGAFLRRFWSPDYFRLVTENINQYKFQQSQTLKTQLNNAIRENAAKIEDHSMKRGAFMLLYCLFFLIYNSFEGKDSSDIDKTNVWFSLFVSSVYVIAILLMSGFSMKKWRWVVFHIGLYVAIFVLVLSIGVVDENNINYFGWVNWLKVHLVVVILSPIAYQLYINWLYSQAYVQHLISTLNDEYEKYLKTNKAIIEKNKDLVDECYVKVFSDSYFDNSGQDVVITNFNQAVLCRLITACRPPHPIVLIKKWASIKIDKNNIEKIKKIESKYQFTDVEVIPQNDNEAISEVIPQFDKLIEEYANRPGISLSTFCKEKNIDLGSFKKYRKNKLYKA